MKQNEGSNQRPQAEWLSIRRNGQERFRIRIDPRTMRLKLVPCRGRWQTCLVSGKVEDHGDLKAAKLDEDENKEVEVSHLDVVQQTTIEGNGKPGTNHTDFCIEPPMYYQLLAGDGRDAEISVDAMTANGVEYVVGGQGKERNEKVTLVSDAYLSVERGRLCAIMGMSGCGKSLFLEILADARKPTGPAKGNFKFWFDASAEGHRAGATGKADYQIKALDPVEGVNKIAFVRQEDPLLADLTLEQSLTFRCRLMWPWMSHEVVKRTVRSAAHIVAPKSSDRKDAKEGDKEFDQWMGRRIGAPLDRDGVMSGGQRRRANIAHELIGHPLGLLMDEPTSGLSSSDALKLISSLKEHANRYKIPMVMSVHQPPWEVYKVFDTLLVMAKPGRVIFHGSRKKVCQSLFRKVVSARLRGKFKDGSVFLDSRDPDLPRCIRELGLFALHEFAETCTVIGNFCFAEDGKFCVAEEVSCDMKRDKSVLEGWVPSAMLEAFRYENIKEGKAVLKDILTRHGTSDLSTNPADAISSFLALLNGTDAEVLGDREDRERLEFEPSQDDSIRVTGGNGDPLAARRLRLSQSAGRLARIWWVLAKRSVCVLRRDTGGFVFLVAQGIILALLLLLAFHDHGSDRFGGLDLFAGTVRTNKQYDEILISKPGHDSKISKDYQAMNWTNRASLAVANRDAAAMRADRRWERIPGSVEAKDPWYLDGHARHRGTVLFLVAFAVLWLAVVSGAREISQDYPVIIHEGKLGVGPAPVALSRFAVLWAISCWHAIWLVWAGGSLVEEQSVVWYVQAWLSMVCLGGLATASGLLISAFSASQRMALVVVPFVTVPQVLFAGVLQSFPFSGPEFNWVARFLPLRLGWEALLSGGRLWTNGVIQLDWKGVDTSSTDAMGTFIKSTEVTYMGWGKLYFGDAVWPMDARWIMAGCTAGMMTMVWWRLRSRIKRGVEG